MINIFIGLPSPEQLEDLNSKMADWTMSAARGECAWICSDCCTNFSDGMPDECVYNIKSCTSIIIRDKQEAQVKLSGL